MRAEGGSSTGGPPGASRRPAVLAGLVLGFVLLVIAGTKLGDGDDTTYRLRFRDAGQLVKGNEVRLGGRSVGTVTGVRLTQGDEVEVRIAVSGPAVPVRRGTRAVIRATSLAGVASRYVALQPGPGTEPELPDGTTIGVASTMGPVELDEVLGTFDPATRRRLADVVTGVAAQVGTVGRRARRPPATSHPRSARPTGSCATCARMSRRSRPSSSARPG